MQGEAIDLGAAAQVRQLLTAAEQWSRIDARKSEHFVLYLPIWINIFTTGIIRKICRKQRITVSPRSKICEIKNCTVWCEMLNAVDKISTKKTFFSGEKRHNMRNGWSCQVEEGGGDGQKQDRQSSPTILFCVLCSVTSSACQFNSTTPTQVEYN